MAAIDRKAYADMFGPTVGDRVRLGDTELWIGRQSDSGRNGSKPAPQ